MRLWLGEREVVPAMRSWSSHSGNPSDAPGKPGQLVQVVPLRVNAVGGVSLLVQVPWKPSVVLAPAAMAAL